MPSYGLPHVKCEPLSESDEEDISSHLVHSYHSLKQASSTSLELRRLKHEPDSGTSDDNVPNDILRHLQQPSSLEELTPPAPPAPSATPVCIKQEPADCSIDTLESASHAEPTIETLESTPHTGSNLHLERHLSLLSSELQSEFMPLIPVKDEPSSEGEQAQLSGDDTSDSCSAAETIHRTSPKSWTQQDMDNALEALRKHNMSLTKASATYGIPSTTLWQRAHRLGIDTPKKEGSSKSWSEADLRGALHALRAGAISANKASKAYGIPSSTLYKIARREGIRLAAPFNAAPTSWRPSDLERALDSIRSGHNSVQRASAQFGIPTGTLYGRCKREGIELSRSNPTPWSEDAMGEALEAVRVGQMSINQAAIHYNLPYSSLYGRFKRCKYPQSPQQIQQQGVPECPEIEQQNQTQDPPYQQYHQQNIQMSHTMHLHPEHNVDHMNAMHYHPNTMHHHMPDSSVNAQMHDPSMLTNVMLHEEAYVQPAMYYSQTHTNGITTS